MEGGEVYDKRVDVVYGHPKNRMSWDDLVAKFKDCASYARRPFDDAAADGIAAMVREAESLPGVGALMDAVR